MQILIAADSYKDCLGSVDVGKAMAQGVAAVLPAADVVVMPVSDGGEGFLEAVEYAFGGWRMKTDAHDALMRPITTEYLFNSHTKEAFIETARTCGLSMLNVEERNPENTTTYGLGETMLSAVRHGAEHIYVGLGGSATNDGGTGMLTALGYAFLDTSGNCLEGRGKNLKCIDKIDASGVCDRVKEAHFTGLCDVKAPFCGPTGATFVFAPQKGADPQQLERLEEGMQRFSRWIRNFSGLDVANLSGTGAAGGLGGALKAFLHADLISGIDFLLGNKRFDEALRNADLMITGEGSLDEQSKMGKAVFGILKKAAEFGIPVLAVAGKISSHFDAKKAGLIGAFAASPPAMPLAEALRPQTAVQNIINATAGAVKLLFGNK